MLRCTGLRPSGAWVLGLMLLAGGLQVARGQTASLSGFITDASDGQAMPLVNVVLATPDSAFVTGAATSGDGAYVFPRIAPGRYSVQASYLGYHVFQDTLDLAAGESRLLNITLVPDALTLNELLVQDARAGTAARVVAGLQVIRPAEIELVPSPDLSADLAGYLTTLPAVVSVGDRGGQLFIRGGESTQNLVLLDGMPVYQPFHMLGFYSAFPADVLRSADFFAGGFGARYGGRLSSVLDIATRNGNSRAFGGTVSVSPFVSSVLLEGPVVPGHASLLVSVRQSFLEEGAERLMRASLPLKFGDAFAKLYVEPGPTARLSVTALSTYDRGTLSEAEAAADELRWRNEGLSLRFVSLPRFAPFLGELQFSYSRLEAEQGPPGAVLRASSVREVRATATGTFYGGEQVETEAGIEVNALHLENELGSLFENTFFDALGFHNIALFITTTVTPGAGFQISPGLRTQFYRLDSNPHLEPRIRFVWENQRHHVSAAAGLYFQEVMGVNDRRDATGVFTAWTYTPGVGEQPDDVRAGRLGRAVHTLLGYRITPTPDFEASVEGFYKRYDNLFVPEWTASPRPTTRLQPATGRAYGFDARVAFQGRPVYGQLSYGYSNTLYASTRARYELWYGTETLRFRPPHDRRHQVSALVGVTLAGFDVNARWQFGSGLPFSRALGFGGFILMNSPAVDVGEEGTRRVIYERPFNAVLPAFHRLDVSVERSFALTFGSLALQASAINVYNRRNIFYLDVFTLQRADQLPFVPSVGLKLVVS